MELVVTMFCTALLSSLLLSVLLFARATHSKVAKESLFQTRLLSAASRLSEELSRSDSTTLTDMTGSGDQALSFLSATDVSGDFTVNGDGAPKWQKYVVYFIPSGSGELMRGEYYGDFTGPASVSRLAEICGSRKGCQPIAKVSSLRLKVDLSTGLLVFTIAGPTESGEVRTLQRTVVMAN